MSGDEPVWSPPGSPLRKAVDYTLACGCTLSDACPYHLRRAEAEEEEQANGSSDEWYWDPDR